MNEAFQDPNIDPELAARLVAFVLGESSAWEMDELQRMAATEPAVQAYLDRLRAVHGLLGEVSQGDPLTAGTELEDWKLPAAERRELLALLAKPLDEIPADGAVEDLFASQPDVAAVPVTRGALFNSLHTLGTYGGAIVLGLLAFFAITFSWRKADLPFRVPFAKRLSPLADQMSVAAAEEQSSRLQALAESQAVRLNERTEEAGRRSVVAATKSELQGGTNLRYQKELDVDGETSHAVEAEVRLGAIVPSYVQPGLNDRSVRGWAAPQLNWEDAEVWSDLQFPKDRFAGQGNAARELEGFSDFVELPRQYRSALPGTVDKYFSDEYNVESNGRAMGLYESAQSAPSAAAAVRDYDADQLGSSDRPQMSSGKAEWFERFSEGKGLAVPKVESEASGLEGGKETTTRGEAGNGDGYFDWGKDVTKRLPANDSTPLLMVTPRIEAEEEAVIEQDKPARETLSDLGRPLSGTAEKKKSLSVADLTDNSSDPAPVVDSLSEFAGGELTEDRPRFGSNVEGAGPLVYSYDGTSKPQAVDNQLWSQSEYSRHSNVPNPVAPHPARKARGLGAVDQLGIVEDTTAEKPYSTFSLHVSDVAFKLSLAALAEQQWPDPAKIRIEEFVNAFDYGDPLPEAGQPVSCVVEQAAHPFLQQRNVMRISLRTGSSGRAANCPLQLTLLLDTSGSMERADRRQTLHRAIETLADQLRPEDRLTLISFARQPRLVAEQLTGKDASALVQAVEGLPSEGGTNIEAALQLAFGKAREHYVEGAQNRVVLLTDGAVNLGDADPGNLAQFVRTMRAENIAFDATGVCADGLNDEVLETLTRSGDGRYYLIDTGDDIDEGFAKQLAGALRPAAANVKVQIHFNPQRVEHYKLIGFDNHLLAAEDFRNDQVDAAELAAAEAGVALYQFEPKPSGSGDVGTISVRFRDVASGQMVEHLWPIPYDANPPSIPDAAGSMKVATAAAMLASKFRNEPLGTQIDFQQIAELVNNLPAEMRGAKRVEQLIWMIQKARVLAGN